MCFLACKYCLLMPSELSTGRFYLPGPYFNYMTSIVRWPLNRNAHLSILNTLNVRLSFKLRNILKALPFSFT